MSTIFSSRFRLLPRRLRHTDYPQFADWASAAPRGAAAARRLDNRDHKVSTPTPPPQLSPSLAVPKSESLDRRRGREVGCNVQTTNPMASSAATKSPTTTKWKQVKGKVSASELKRLMKEYGPIAVGFHFSVFLTTLGGFYSFIDYGLDVASLVKNTPFISDNLPHPSAGNLALAWGLTTVTGPFRGVMTVTLTPRVARLWRGCEAKRKLGSSPKEEGGKGAC